MTEYEMQTSTVVQQETFQTPTNLRETDAYSFGDFKAHYSSIIRRGSQQKTVLVTMRCLLTS